MNPSNYVQIEPLEEPVDIFNLHGRVGVIVGSAGKMDQQLAKVISLAGATVVIADVDRDFCKELAHSSASQTGGKLLGITCNVSSQDQSRHLFERVDKELGTLDFLISSVMAKPEGYYCSFHHYPAETLNRCWT